MSTAYDGSINVTVAQMVVCVATVAALTLQRHFRSRDGFRMPSQQGRFHATGPRKMHNRVISNRSTAFLLIDRADNPATEAIRSAE